MPAAAAKSRPAKPRVKLLTAEEYGDLALEENTELVRGRIVHMPPPFSWHGYISGNAVGIFREFVTASDAGIILTNETGVVTKRGPDTVRGADMAFYAKKKNPRKLLKTRGYLPFPPDMALEVKSPDQPWKSILTKVAEYLEVGVQIVIVLDTVLRTATVYQADEPAVTLSEGDTLTLPKLLPGFKVKVGKFFE